MISRKTFMQLYMFILYGVMLHLDGICYALYDEMLCNAKIFMQDADAWSKFGYIQLCLAGCILELNLLVASCVKGCF